MLTPEQKAARRGGIGASEAAAALGLSAFDKGPLTVWASKVLPEEEAAPSARMDFGHKVERIFVPKLYEEDRGVRLIHNETTIPGPAPLFATPDLIGPDRLVEAKNVGERMADAWAESGTYKTWEKGLCPFDYFLQGQLQCLVVNRPGVMLYGQPAPRFERFDLAALIGGYDFRILTFPYDEELALGVVAELDEFWRTYVVPKVQPPADSTPGAMSILKRRFPRATSPIVPASTAEEFAAIGRLTAAKEWMRQAKEEEEAACAHMAEVLGEREGLTCPTGKVVWREQKTNPAYKDIALQLGATPEQIEATRKSTRVMNWYPSKEKKP